MAPDDQQEKSRVLVAAHLRAMRENWPMQLDILAFKAKMARARYLALRQEGFAFDEALRLCLEDVKL
ncbi:MAG: hypothetical protein ACT6S0_04795 [Roseateles sp.]|uniref:hypothetical protein n=1 Tax=Roseateles sp. TaxID=1971397 RepID=UPI00403696D7